MKKQNDNSSSKKNIALDSFRQGRAMERINLASTLHDEISGPVNIALMLLNKEFNSKSTLTPELKQAIKLLKSVISQSRSISHQLFDEDESSLVLDLDEFQKKIDTLIENYKLANTLTTLNISYLTELINASPDILSILYSCTREFLQNSLKHSKCSNISIEFNSTRNNITLDYKDDGTFNLQDLHPNGIGLKIISLLIDEKNGDMQFYENTPSGFKAMVALPHE